MGNEAQDDPTPGQGQDWEAGPPAEGQNGAIDAAPAVLPPTPPPQEKEKHLSGRRRGAPAGVGAAPKAPGRPSGKAGAVPERFDAHASGAPKWTSREVEVLWPELLEWLEANGKSAYDVVVNVIRIEPPPRQSIGYAFEASAVVGNQEMSPTTAIKQYVEDYYHNIARGPARYELQFIWKTNGQYVVNGYISLQSQGEINALRQAQWQQRMASQYGAQPGFAGAPMMPRLPPAPPGQPQQQQQPQPPQPPQPPPPYGFSQYGYPPPSGYGFPPPQQSDLERRLAAIEEENKRLRSQLSAPQRPPYPGAGAPPSPQPLTAESLAGAVVAAIKHAGLGAAPAAAPDMFEALERGMTMMERFRKFGERTQQFFEPEEPEPLQLPAPEEVKEDNIPWDVSELPSQWDDGSKAKLPLDKETGKVDLLGLAMLNPRPTQKLVNALAHFMERLGPRGLAGAPEDEEQQEPQLQFQPPMQQLPQQQYQQPQYQPPPQQPQQQQTQQPPPPPTAPSDGGNGGWLD
jgi:hypothetical protein